MLPKVSGSCRGHAMTLTIGLQRAFKAAVRKVTPVLEEAPRFYGQCAGGTKPLVDGTQCHCNPLRPELVVEIGTFHQ